MFGQSWKVKKGTQWAFKGIAKKYFGASEETAKAVGKKVGLIAGVIVAVKTCDFIGAKGMLFEEVVDSTIDEGASDVIDETVVDASTENTASTIHSASGMSPSDMSDHASTTTFSGAGSGSCTWCGGMGYRYWAGIGNKVCSHCNGTTIG